MHLNKVFLCLIGLIILGTEAAAIEEGCNGDDDGIPCCDDGFILGDNDNGAEEMFIQAGDYKSNCLDSCKSLYKNSIGITESLKQKYSSGNGKNKNKCWCEFGNVKLDATNENYQTCVFAVPGSVVSPVAEPLKRPTVPTTSTTSTTTAAGEVNLGVGASHEFFYSLSLMSHNGNARDYATYTEGDPGCCQKCDKRFGPGRTDLYNYKFDQKYNHKLCECFSFRGPSTPERRTRVWSKRSGTTIGYCGNNSTFVDQVDGTFGDDRSFYFRSVDQLGSIWFRPNPEGIPSTSDLCCEECSNKFPESQMFTFGRVGDNYCYCYKEIPGKRPETFGEGTYNGFCGNE